MKNERITMNSRENKIQKNKRIIKNLIIRNKKKLIKGTFAICATACFLKACGPRHYEAVDASIVKVVENNEENTNLDEIFELEETINTTEVFAESLINGLKDSEKTIVESSFIDSMTRLENYVNLSWKIDELKLKNTDEVKDINSLELINQLQDMSYEEVISLIEAYKNKDLTDIEHARLEQKIVFLKNYYEFWITKNGLKISESLLKKTIKSGACYAIGLEPEYYGNCSIVVPVPNSGDGYKISVKEPVSGKTFEYKVKEVGLHSAYDQAIDLLCNVQNLQGKDNISFKTILSRCSNSIENTKLLVQGSSKLTVGNKLATEISMDKAYKKLIKIK